MKDELDIEKQLKAGEQPEELTVAITQGWVIRAWARQWGRKRRDRKNRTEDLESLFFFFQKEN